VFPTLFCPTIQPDFKRHQLKESQTVPDISVQGKVLTKFLNKSWACSNVVSVFRKWLIYWIGAEAWAQVKIGRGKKKENGERRDCQRRCSATAWRGHHRLHWF